MNVNLRRAYGLDHSPPRSKDLFFFSQKSDFLFEDAHDAVVKCQAARRAYRLEWRLCHNCVEVPFLTGECRLELDNLFTIDVPVAGLKPGFYDLRVKVQHTAKIFTEGFCSFGWKASTFSPELVKPQDFDAFWRRAVEKLGRVELGLTVEKCMTLDNAQIDAYNLNSASLPENYDPEGCRHDHVEVYKIEFNGVAGFTGGTRVQAWFAKPVGAGPFPAMLVLPGAGNGPRPAPVEHARHGYAALDVQVHCEPVDNPPELYRQAAENNFADPALVPERMTHYSVYLNALQAVNALLALPGVDKERLAVVGGSQGGRLTAVVGALDPRVKAGVPNIPHYSNIPYVLWYGERNAAKDNGADGFSPAQVLDRRRLELESYFDVANFADQIRCPLLVCCGMIDPVSSATGVFSLYNRLNSPKKKILSMPVQGHDCCLAVDTYAWRWLNETLGA